MTRLLTLTAMGLATAAVVSSAFTHPTPRLVWNASASVPIGLYAVQPAGALYIGELVVVEAPETLSHFLDERNYLPAGLPLLKHIIGLSGQVVCRLKDTITVDGAAIGDALERDRRERPLPVWSGCRVIQASEIFLMNPQSKDSLDGRYFGLLPTGAIVGLAQPLWIKGTH